MAKSRGPQKNFALGEALVQGFEQWCRDRGHDDKAVFLTSWMVLAQLTPTQRTQAFRQVNDWIAGGFPTNDGDAGESGVSADRTSSKSQPAPPQQRRKIAQ